ncbi:hypothetical protein FB451DRAFT_1126863 [Mycena latifolia]|nr:hypothetical protein FB451DRAFT_1126863 [Mycena latifolia]
MRAIVLQSRIDALDDELRHLDSDFPLQDSSLQDRVPLLEIILHDERRVRLTKELENLRQSLASIVYPILTLPFELTSEIFLHCLPNTPIEPSPTTAPLLLTRVCKQWRDIALAEGRLWASLQIDGGHSGDDALRAIKDWVHRAGSFPQSHGLAVAWPECGLDFVTFEPYREYFDPFAEGPGRCLATAWGHLVRFVGDNFSPDQCFELLRRVPGLIHCELNEMVDPGVPLVIPHAPLLHTRLQSFIVRSDKSVDYGSSNVHYFQLFRWLQLPALRTLELGWYLPCTDIALFLQFLTTATAIEKFSAVYDQTPAQNGTLLSMLNAMPALKHLAVELYSHQAVVDIFRLLGDSTLFLPHVQSIAFTLLDLSDHFTWEDTHTHIVLDALISRAGETPAAGVAQLLEFTLVSPEYAYDFDDEPPIGITDCLQELKDKGMKVHVSLGSGLWV